MPGYRMPRDPERPSMSARLQNPTNSPCLPSGDSPIIFRPLADGADWHSRTKRYAVAPTVTHARRTTMATQRQSVTSIFDVNLRAGKIALAMAVLFPAMILAAAAAQAQTYDVIHAFTGGPDGGLPGTSLIMDRGGNLYGSTASNPGSFGGVFKLARRGAGWVVTTLHVFEGTEGSGTTTLILGPDGSVYGTNRVGGGGGSCSQVGCGTIFKLTPPATVCHSVDCPWSATILYRFTGQADGGNPMGIVFDPAGNLYGATQGGGTSTNCGRPGCGVVFELSPSNGSWTESVLHNFTGAPDDGYQPYAGVIRDSGGNLYGTTNGGGSNQGGTAYQLSPSGSGWAETILHNFENGPRGSAPNAGLILDTAGDLYSTLRQGGGSNRGAVYSILPSNGEWTETLLHSFTDSNGDEYPALASLLMDPSGNLYGTTPGLDGNPSDSPPTGDYGNLFMMTLSNGGWNYISLYRFTGGSDGGSPFSTPIRDASGNLYGTTSSGGIQNVSACNGGCGVVWEITP